MSERRNDLDALRSFAMTLGIAVHASLAFFQDPWPVHDSRPSVIARHTWSPDGIGSPSGGYAGYSFAY